MSVPQPQARTIKASHVSDGGDEPPLTEEAGIWACLGRLSAAPRGRSLIVVKNADSLVPRERAAGAVGIVQVSDVEVKVRQPPASISSRADSSGSSINGDHRNRGGGKSGSGRGDRSDRDCLSSLPDIGRLIATVEEILWAVLSAVCTNGGMMLVTANSALQARRREDATIRGGLTDGQVCSGSSPMDQSPWKHYHLGGGAFGGRMLKGGGRGSAGEAMGTQMGEPAHAGPSVGLSAAEAATRTALSGLLEGLDERESRALINACMGNPVLMRAALAAVAEAAASSTKPQHGRPESRATAAGVSGSASTDVPLFTGLDAAPGGTGSVVPAGGRPGIKLPPSARPSSDLTEAMGGGAAGSSANSSALPTPIASVTPSGLSGGGRGALPAIGPEPLTLAALGKALSCRGGAAGIAAAAAIKASLSSAAASPSSGAGGSSGGRTPSSAASALVSALSFALSSETASPPGSLGGMASSTGASSATAVAVASMLGLLSGLPSDLHNAVLALSTFPAVFTEAGAAAVMGVQAYVSRATLEMLEGLNLLVRNARMGGFSLPPTVREAASQLLMDSPEREQVTAACRFISHALGSLRQADKMYNTAVQASMQLALEIRGDLEVAMHLAATCSSREKVLAVLGIDGIVMLSRTPVLPALALDATSSYEELWRSLAGSEAPAPSASSAAQSAGTPIIADAPLISSPSATAPAPKSAVRKSGGGIKGSREGGGGASGLASVAEDAGLQAIALRCLGHALFKANRFVESEAALRSCLGLCGDVYGRESLELASCYNSLGQLLATTGRYGEAETVLRHALLLRQKRLGPNHLDVAASKNSLARVFRGESRHSEAESLYREALSIRTALLPDCHPDLAESYNSIGISLGQQKRYAEEERLYRQALDIRRRALGMDHPEVAQALNNVGTSLANQGKHAEAEATFREALSIKSLGLGPDHPSIGVSLNNIGRAQAKQGRLAEAEATYRRALAIIEASLGPAHPAAATCLANVVSMLRKQPGREKEAAEARADYHRRFSASRQAIAATASAGNAEVSPLNPISEASITGGDDSSGGEVISVSTFGRHPDSLASAQQHVASDRYSNPSGAADDEDDDDPGPPVDGSLLLEETVSGSFGRKVGAAVSAAAAEALSSSVSYSYDFESLASTTSSPSAEDRWRPSTRSSSPTKARRGLGGGGGGGGAAAKLRSTTTTAGGGGGGVVASTQERPSTSGGSGMDPLSLEGMMGAWNGLSGRDGGMAAGGRSALPPGLASDLSLSDLAASYGSLASNSGPSPANLTAVGSPVMGLVVGPRGGGRAPAAAGGSRLGPSGSAATAKRPIGTHGVGNHHPGRSAAAAQPRGSAPMRASYSVLDALLSSEGGGGPVGDLPANPFMHRPKLAH